MSRVQNSYRSKTTPFCVAVSLYSFFHSSFLVLYKYILKWVPRKEWDITILLQCSHQQFMIYREKWKKLKIWNIMYSQAPQWCHRSPIPFLNCMKRGFTWSCTAYRNILICARFLSTFFITLCISPQVPWYLPFFLSFKRSNLGVQRNNCVSARLQCTRTAKW